MTIQYSFRAPQTEIPGALAALQQANSQMHQRDLIKQQADEAKSQNRFGNIVGVGSALVAGYVTGWNPQAMAGAFAVGSNVGRAAKGGEANVGQVASGAASIYGATQDQAQVEAERQTLSNVRSQAAAARSGDSLAAGGSMIPDSAAPGAIPTAQDRLIAGSLKSPSPFRTALAGAQVLSAMAPDQTREIKFGADSTALVTTDSLGHIKQNLGTEKRQSSGAPDLFAVHNSAGEVTATAVPQEGLNDAVKAAGPGAQAFKITTEPTGGGKGYVTKDIYNPDTKQTEVWNYDSTSGKLVNKIGITKPTGEAGGTKDFQTFSPVAMNNSALKELFTKYGGERAPQLAASLDRGELDMSTVSAQLKLPGITDNSTPQQREAAYNEALTTTKLGQIDQELQGTRWSDESKAAATKFKQGIVNSRTEARIGFLTDQAAANPQGFLAGASALKDSVGSMKYVDQKRILGEIDRTTRGLSEAGAKDATNQDALFKRQLEKLPPGQRKGLETMPPGQREKELDKRLSEQSDRQQRAESYVKQMKAKQGSGFGKVNVSDASIRQQTLRILGGYFTEDDKQQLLISYGLGTPKDKRVASE